MPDDIYETPSTTPNFRTELAAQLADLVPEAIADGKVDVEKLKELLDGDAADGNERFGLFWPGKKRALRAAQEPTTATLKPDFENSKDWDTTKNVFIEGDNLEVLKVLQKHYHAKIKMIYIDPPYNTGKDFVYPDNYKEGLDTYLEWTRQVNEEGKKVSTNAETEGRYHSNWLNMMYPRLKLARNLLTDDGVIFISIDDNEVDNLRKLCNEVFGENNFISECTIISNPRGRQSDTFVANVHDKLLIYSRNMTNAVVNGMPLSNEQRAEFSLTDEGGAKYRLLGLRQRGAASNREDRPDMFFPIYVKPDTKEISLEKADGWDVVYPKKSDGRDGRWMWGKDKCLRDKSLLVARFIQRRSEYDIFVKDFLERGEGERTKKFKSLWDLSGYNNQFGTQEVKGLFKSEVMSFPKPRPLIEDICRMGMGQSDLILDFFAGSATTAHALMQLNAEDGGNRRFIMVQLPEPTPKDSEARKAGFATIADISRKRIELAGEKIKADSPLTTEGLDTGFRAYKLADTNFAKWRVSSDIEPDALQQRLLSLREGSSAESATFDSLLTEILLKQGYSLTEKVTPVEIAGLELRSVGEGIVLAYLNEHVKPTLEQLRAVVDEKPQRIIVLEDAFQGDDELKTNLVQLAKSKGIELWTA